MAAGETESHLALKRASLVWAQSRGYRACALEVRVPNCNYRADAAAYRTDRAGGIGETIVFECKQSRADFLRDAADLEESRGKLMEARARLDALEQLLGLHFPHLRRGDSLFPEYDRIKAEDIDHAGYRRVRKLTDALERKIFGGTKFDDLTRWRAANVFYLVVVPGIVVPGEVPCGWGLLERKEDGELVEVRRPVNFEVEEKARILMLEQIARKATSLTNRDEGIVWEDFHPEDTTKLPDAAEDSS